MYHVYITLKSRNHDHYIVDSCKVLSMLRVLELRKSPKTWYVPLENVEQWSLEEINDNEQD